MKYIKFCIDKPVTIIMFVLTIILFGSVSLSKLKVNLLPDISYPMVTIRTEFSDVSPKEIETLISKPIEETVGTVNNVIKVSSVSKIGYSDVYVEFLWKTDLDFAIIDLKEKLDLVKLPNRVGKPYILRYDPSLDPVLKYGVKIKEFKYNMKQEIDVLINRKLQRIDGVAYINTNGILDPEIQIDINEENLSKFNLTINEVASKLALNNVNVTGGQIEEGNISYVIRAVNEFKNIEDIKNTVIVNRNNYFVKLKDIASIKKHYKKQENAFYINGEKGIEIEIFKAGDSNSVDVSNRVKKAIKKIKKDLKENYSFELIYDQSVYITESIKNVYYAAIYGAFLAILVLLLFIRKFDLTAIISFSIPVSIIATFNLMFFQNISLNMMSLGGLALGVGMMVDNGIVVIENIFRYTEMGYSTKDSALKGTSEIFYAVLGSTITTICVFLPLAFVEGIAGQLFKDQAFTITYSLVASLIVSLTLIPMLSAKIDKLKLNPISKKENLNLFDKLIHFIKHYIFKPIAILIALPFKLILKLLEKSSDIFNKFMDYIKNRFVDLTKIAINNVFSTMVITLIVFILSLMLYSKIGVDLFPEIKQNEFYLKLRLTEGNPIEKSIKKFRTIENSISEIQEIESIFLTIGSLKGSGGSSQSEFGTNLSQLYIKVNKDANIELVIEMIKDKLKDFADLKYNFTFDDKFTFTAPIEIEITGEDIYKLRKYSTDIVNKIKTIEGLYDVKSNLLHGNPEVIINFDHLKIANNNLNVSQISSVLENKIRGNISTTFNLSLEEKIDINVKLKDIDNLSELEDIVIKDNLKLKDIATLKIFEGPSQITRKKQKRVASITSKIKDIDLLTATKLIRKKLKDVKLEDGYFMDISGQNETMKSSFSSLKFALTLAIVLVYMVLASLFESFIYPFIIMFSVPFAVIGVLITLYLTGTNLTVIAYIGFIMLAGIVVNDAIVLVDFINHLRSEKKMDKKEAILEAVKLRFRPIMMTTLTTILGLLPMAFGLETGAEIRSPMAITVIGGLTTSTLLTLVIIPVVYVIIDRFSNKYEK